MPTIASMPVVDRKIVTQFLAHFRIGALLVLSGLAYLPPSPNEAGPD